MDRNRKWNLVFEFVKDQGLSVFSLLLVLLLAAGAFALSYSGLKELAEHNGVNPQLVWIWPLVLDGAIIVFSVCAFRAGICGESITYPMFLVVISTLASIGFNILHAPVPEGATFWTEAALVPRIMASIPPLALFLSFEVMIRQLNSQVKQGEAKASREAEGELSRIEEPAPLQPAFAAATPTHYLPDDSLVAAKSSRREPQPKVVVEETDHDVEEAEETRPKPKLTAAEARKLVEEMCKNGALLDEMAEASGRAPRTVVKYLHDADLSAPMGA